MSTQDRPGSEGRRAGPGSASCRHVPHVQGALATCARERRDRGTGVRAGRGRPAPPPAPAACRSDGGPLTTGCSPRSSSCRPFLKLFHLWAPKGGQNLTIHGSVWKGADQMTQQPRLGKQGGPGVPAPCSRGCLTGCQGRRLPLRLPRAPPGNGLQQDISGWEEDPRAGPPQGRPRFMKKELPFQHED